MSEKEKVEVAIQCHKCKKTYILKVFQEDLDEYHKPRYLRMHIQDIFPYLPPQERELFISQTCNDCWSKFMNFLYENFNEEVDEDDN